MTGLAGNVMFAGIDEYIYIYIFMIYIYVYTRVTQEGKNKLGG